MTVLALARPEVRSLRSYRTPELSDDMLRLNANEAPLAVDTGSPNGLNRYPARRPADLGCKMAAYYGVQVENVLVTRGSSEGIDLLVRTFCSPGRDEILLTPPAFEMYEIYAAIQGARVRKVPLLSQEGFALDVDALLAATSQRTNLIFLCAPNNPVGSVIPHEQIMQILIATKNKCVVVVDEAYIEYSDSKSMLQYLPDYENLVVLRSLSKGLALAGIRCGAVIASPELVSLLDRVLAPFAMSSPTITKAENALAHDQLAVARASIRELVRERDRVRDELSACPAIEKVWPSQANFLFARFRDIHSVIDRLEQLGISIRTFQDSPIIESCARISIGTPGNNDRLLNAIRSVC